MPGFRWATFAMVTDPEAHKKLWVDLLGGEIVHKGSLEMIKFPGIYIVAGKARAAVEGSDGIHHRSFRLRGPELCRDQGETHRAESTVLSRTIRPTSR